VADKKSSSSRHATALRGARSRLRRIFLSLLI